MIIRRTCQLLLYACTLACGLALAPASQADFIVHADTSSLPSGTQGFIDIQFDPGPGSPLATATVTNFSTDAMFLSFINVPSMGGPVSANIDGDASGTLPGPNFPGPLTISNDGGPLNDVYQPVTYGSYISFDVAFSGSPAGSSLGLMLYGSDFATPLLVDNNSSDAAFSPNGAVIAINLNSDGSATILTFPDPNNPNFDPTNPNSPSDGTVTPQASIPEPSTWLLLSIGAAGVWTMRKRMGIMPIS